MTIGDNIKRYRKENKLTQKGLGDLIGKSTISIRKYEANDIVPSLKVLKEISEALNININKLTGENNNNNELDEYIDKIGSDKFILTMNVMKKLDPNILKAIEEHTINMSYDDFTTLKNKTIYKHELDNQILLYDKLEPKQMELLYLSKINDLNSIMESQNNMIKHLENMVASQGNMIKILGGSTDGE